MYTTTAHREGDSVTLSLPAEIQDRLHLQDGDQVRVAVEGDHLLVARQEKTYSLEQLLQEHAEIIDELPVDRAWLDAKPVGREIL